MRRPVALMFAIAGAGLVHASVVCGAEFGTYERPFTVDSPWNARPLNPVLGDFEVPKSDYSPTVAGGKWSTGVFLARPSDPPVVVLPLAGKAGVWDPDAEAYRPNVRIPRWPAGVSPAIGSDGHADIVDPEMGVVHSFFQLRQEDGQWRATQYSWTKLDGRGWGEPGHYFQGARAAGVPTMGGLIRKHEIDDGQPHFQHALAMSLTFNALSADPTYIFPATSADRNAATTNSGAIAEGALMMLPPTFDTAGIANPDLRKVAETLKVHGAYVVDRNHGTPFVIYVENGSGYKLHRSGWDSVVARDLDRIRAALRQVVAVSDWVDGAGWPMKMESNLNRLSMRGPWRLERGPAIGTFETWAQAVVFPVSTERIVQSNRSGRNVSTVSWARPEAGRRYQLTAKASGGAALRLRLYGDGGVLHADSGELGAGQSSVITWPSGPVGVVLTAYSGTSGDGSSVGGSLLALP